GLSRYIGVSPPCPSQQPHAKGLRQAAPSAFRKEKLCQNSVQSVKKPSLKVIWESKRASFPAASFSSPLWKLRREIGFAAIPAIESSVTTAAPTRSPATATGASSSTSFTT